MTYKLDKTRPLSWSSISSFEYDREKWFKKYVLGEKPPTSKEMEFGSHVGKQLETNPEFLPEVIRLPHMEYELRAVCGGIPMVGYMDSFCEKTKHMIEYKTGKQKWDKKRVDNHGQIDMYLFLLYLIKGIKPEEVSVTLYWLPTKDNGDFTISFTDDFKPHTFKTKRTTKDILMFGAKIQKVWKEMEEYVNNYKENE